MNLRIAVIGGGVGGLCLAQGLHKAGMDVTVYERDRTPEDRLQGYRVHIDPHGARALHDCLPSELWKAFLATTGTGGQDFGFLTEQLEELLVLRTEHSDDPAENHHSVSRITLRQVLLTGLDEVVRFGKTFERYERTEDGPIRLHFADGSSATADIVVGADGGNSPVRRQYLPHARRVDTGILTVAGKFPLTEHARSALTPRLWEGPNSIIPPPGAGFFIAPHDLGEDPVVLPGGIGATETGGALFDNSSSYILWAYGAADGRMPDDVSTMSGERLRDTVAALIGDWHPDLRMLVTMSHPEAVSLLPIRTSVPVAPWAATTVTLLGDAIHSMTPMRGIGANTALRDARLLCLALTGGKDPVEAIAAYEAEMREYGFAAVRDSLRAAKQFVGGSAMARAGFKSFLRTASRLPALRRRVFS
ncbi:FAD-dependent oxidoreductase [Sphaerisporangium fuscum]|uniref:FAD-dependent oxidoreductase n=1 Tax=Sphaerisporangium fuscum TaxID=2835868 RepID=UPI001BDC16A0|nr:NAD(P)/FAD-dependent oxidoreductase [Sphaerisporangium fuscum]